MSKASMTHTTIETKDGWTRMVYHNTCVAAYECKEGSNAMVPTYAVKLNTGGYFTATTKKRMNQFAEMFDLPFSVYQDKGEWNVRMLQDGARPGRETYQVFQGNTCEFTVMH